MEEPKKLYPNFKTHVLLPIIFIITLAISILFIANKNYFEDTDTWIFWFWFGVALAYTAIATYDLITNKEKSRKLKIFVIVMIGLNIIADILYVIFYIIAR